MDGMATSQLSSIPTNLTAVSQSEAIDARQVRLTGTWGSSQAIDSGTSLMLVPDEVAKAFYAMVRYNPYPPLYLLTSTHMPE